MFFFKTAPSIFLQKSSMFELQIIHEHNYIDQMSSISCGIRSINQFVSLDQAEFEPSHTIPECFKYIIT